MEIYKSVYGFEGLYEVSNLGNVKSLKRIDMRGRTINERILKPYRDGNQGYKAVSLLKNGVSRRVKLHRLVAIAFLDNPNNLPQVNHINGVKDDNRLENLEWSSVSDNVKHAFDVLKRKSSGGHYGKTGSKHHCSKAVLAEHLESGKKLIFGSSAEAARALGIPSGSIPRCCNGKYKSSHGYKFSYIKTMQALIEREVLKVAA